MPIFLLNFLLNFNNLYYISILLSPLVKGDIIIIILISYSTNSPNISELNSKRNSIKIAIIAHT